MICGERFIRPRSGRALKDKFAERRVRRTDGHYVCSGYLIYAEGQSGNAYRVFDKNVAESQHGSPPRRRPRALGGR